jgi:hypothetical protein
MIKNTGNIVLSPAKRRKIIIENNGNIPIAPRNTARLFIALFSLCFKSIRKITDLRYILLIKDIF